MMKYDGRIIDFHAHIYPEKIAEKATDAIGAFYDASMFHHNASDTELIASGEKIGCRKFVIFSVATKPEQVGSINNFIIKECSLHKEFKGLATLHPDFENLEGASFEKELMRIKDAGLRGVKLHPDFQKFAIDAKCMDKVYSMMNDMNLILLIHAGDCRYNYSNPVLIENVYKKHPGLKIIAAHLGGYTEWDESIKHLCGKDLYFDISSTAWKLSPEKQENIIHTHGASRVLFASDFPMWDHQGEFEKFLKINLAEEEREMILYKNADRLLGAEW